MLLALRKPFKAVWSRESVNSRKLEPEEPEEIKKKPSSRSK